MQRFCRAAFALFASVFVAVGSGPSAVAAEPFEIPAILPMTGGAAFLGKAEADAMHALEDQVNRTGGIKGRPIRFAIVDDQTSPQIAVQLMNQALAKKPAIVIDGGPVTTCRATMALVSSGPVLYCLSPSIHPAAGGYVFSAMYSSNDILAVSMRYLRERGIKKIGVINGTDATGQDADEILAGLIKAPDAVKAGMSFVAYEHFNLADLSVAAQLSRIKAAGAQAVIAYTTGSAIATVLHGLQDASMESLPVITSPGNMSYAQMESYKAFMPKELLFAGPPLLVPEQLTDPSVKKAVASFVDAFKALGGQRGDLLHALGWDPASLVVHALAARGTDASASALRDEIAGTQQFTGVLGKYNFRDVAQRGLTTNWVIVERWAPEKDAWVAVSKPGGGLK